MIEQRISLIFKVVLFCLLFWGFAPQARAQEKLKKLQTPVLSAKLMRNYTLEEATLLKEPYNPEDDFIYHWEYWENWVSRDGNTRIHVWIFEFKIPRGPENLAGFMVENASLEEAPDKKFGEKTWVRSSYDAAENRGDWRILYIKGKMLVEVDGDGPRGERPPYLPDFVESLGRIIESKI